MSDDTEIILGTFSFKKINIIGEGQFGKVYHGKNSKTNAPVCVKVFQKKQEFGENVLQTVNQKELDLTKLMINDPHENLVQILEVLDEENLNEAYIIMELCDDSLTSYCKKKKDKKEKLSQQEMMDFITQVTNGYYHLEERRIVHRDMKPDNILIKIDKDRVIYKVFMYYIQIADFGLGKITANHDLKTKNIGTPYYFAPEIQGSARDIYKSKCDIFSFGIIIFEMLVGPNTFKSVQNREKLKTQDFESLFAEQLTGVHEWLRKLLNNMIIYDLNNRIGWNDLKVIMDLNMMNEYQYIFGRIQDDNLFLGQFKDQQRKLTVKVFEKEDQKELQFIQPYSPVDTTNVIKIDNVINKDNYPLAYVVMEGCDCDLQTLMESQQFSSDEILNFIEQIANGYSAISLLQKKMYSISLQNILVKFDGNKKIYKVYFTHSFRLLIMNFIKFKRKGKNNSQLSLQQQYARYFSYLLQACLAHLLINSKKINIILRFSKRYEIISKNKYSAKQSRYKYVENC